MYLKITTWLLLLTWLYCCISVCMSHKRHKQTSGLKPHVEPDDDDFVEDLKKKSNITRHDSESKLADKGGARKDNIAHIPKELNWDWGAFDVKSNVEEGGDVTSPSKKERKTIIPLEGIVFAKVKDNHVIKSKLSSRTTKATHPKRRLSALSRRFDLYPRWFSNSIPTLFGKHFARRYYKPYGSLESVNAQTRHHILRTHGKPRAGTIFHELPLSWMASSDSRNGIPKKHEIEAADELKPLDEAPKIEGVETAATDDNLILDQPAVEGAGQNDKKTMPFLKDIPHEVMAELNPYEYTVLPGHSEAHPHQAARHHGHAGVAHATRIIGHLPQPQETAESVTAAVPHEGGWAAYSTLPARHHHRHKLNPCYHNPCLNHGHCHFNGGNYKCSCRPGFSGDICDRTRFSCHPNPCYNGGTCTVLQTGYFCTCLPGFRGAECEGQNPCASNPCQNSGKCTDTADGFYCTCGQGYAGKTCGDDIRVEELNVENDNAYAQATGIHDRALAQHVATEQKDIENELEGMILHDKVRDMPVEQKIVFAPQDSLHETLHGTGLRDTNILRGGENLHEPTVLHGTNERGMETGRLDGEHVLAGAPTLHEIAPGGTRVEDIPLGETVVECPLGACLNGGTCVKSATSQICNCPPGHHGIRCEATIAGPITQEISGVPENIANNAAVTPIPLVDAACPLPCKNGGSCAKSVAGFTCKCPAEYRGDTCEDRLPILTQQALPALPPTVSTTPVIPVTVSHGTLEVTHGTVETQTIPVTVIECKIPCRNGGSCLKTATGNACSCPTGYSGTACDSMAPTELHAAEIHPTPETNLALAPTGCLTDSCKNGGTCVKTSIGTVLGHICSCPVGFHGTDCGSPDLCTPNPCENGGSCIQEGDENYKCVCPPGYKGLDCNLANHCTKDPCKNNGVCEETPDSFQCKCAVGFKGRDCTTASPCQLNPCLHKGACIEKGTTYVCQCHPGYKGNTCHMKDVCYPNPCINGLCHEDLGIAICNCSHGWLGHRCDSADFCANSPCLNGGSCEHGANTFKCLCPPEYHGVSCEIQDACHSSPCENNGRCDQAGGTFVCSCPPGFHGERCHLKAHCQPSPCNGHGECFESDEGFICECNPRFMGKYCEIARFCVDNPCVNGGHCIEGDNTFACECPFGYKGKTCAVNVCDSHPCLNGGTCIPAANEDGYGCECVFPYHGVTCGEMDPCLTNPCRNGGICQSQLQSLHDASLHHGLSVFGPYDCFDKDHHCYPDNDKDENPGKGFYDFSKDHRPADDMEKDHRPADDMEKDHRPADDMEKDHRPADDMEKDHRADDNGKDHYNNDLKGVAPYVGDNVKDMRDDADKDQDKDRFGPYGDTTKDTDKDGHLDKEKDGSYDKEKDVTLDKEKDARFDKEKDSYPDKVGSKDTEKDGHMDNEKDSRPAKDDSGHLDTGKDDSGHLDTGKDSQHFGDNPKNNWPIEAKNDHPGLLDKVDYYPKHQPSEPQANEPAPEPKLPPCPCNPQPCTWPPQCQPQSCTPPCRRHYDGHGHHHFDEPGDYKKSNIRSPHNYSQVVFFARRSSKENVHHKIERRDLNKKMFERRYLGKYSESIAVMKRDIGSKPNDYTQLSVKEILALKRDQIISAQASKRLEIIPKVIINYRHPGETSVYKRTMHELYVCQCMPGYLGAHCQHMNPCREAPCTNGGTCIPRGDHYICQCLAGYGGRHCDDPHPCSPNPCTHNGKCHLAKSVRGYECKCKHGWRGYNCEDRDNCALGNPCKHDGNCLNVDGAEGGIECKCRTRYSGKHCEIDACAACDINAYCHHGNCVCENGYFGNGFRCKAMTDICTPNPCDNKGECRPGVDGKLFSCECQPGYVGTRCELPHPCANNPCLHNGACVDESNSKDRGILLLDRNDYKCFCSAGYKGKNCGETSLAACSSGPCQNNGTCFDASSESHSKHLTRTEDYECFCDLGYTGKNCEINHYACYSYPCMNGGTCLDAESLPDINFDAHGYKCNCNHGFTGRNCEVTVYGPGPCHQSPCLNNGRCLDAMNSNDPDIHFDYEHQFKCVCPAQYSGRICEIPYPACFSRPCHNKGICNDRTKEPSGIFDESGYTCTCMAGYDGKNCERQNSLAIMEDPSEGGDHARDYTTEAKTEGKSDEDMHDEVKTEGKKDDDDDDVRKEERLGNPELPAYVVQSIHHRKPHIKESTKDYPLGHGHGEKLHMPIEMDARKTLSTNTNVNGV